MTENIYFKSGAIHASECLSLGWEMIKPRYALFIGMAIVMLLIGFALNMIPFVGLFLNPIVTGVLLCGIYFALLKQRRGEEVGFSMMFAGFEHILPAALVQILGTAPWLAFTFLIYFFPDNFNASSGGGGDSAPLFPILQDSGAAMLMMTLATYLLSFIVNLLLYFVLPLIVEYKLGIADAVKLSINASVANAGGLIVLFLLEGLVILLGTLALGIGLIFALPVTYAMTIAAYKSVFPDTAQAPAGYGDHNEYHSTFGTSI